MGIVLTDGNNSEPPQSYIIDMSNKIMEVLRLVSSFLISMTGDLFQSVYAGYEGRAGMAAIVLRHDHQLNGTEVYNHLVKTLPAYAWPWFLRIQVSHADTLYLQCVFLSVKLYCSFVSLPVLSDLSGCDRDLQAAEGEAGPGGF